MARKRNRGARKRKARLYGGKGGYFDKSKNGEVTAIGKALRFLGGLGGGAIAPFAGAAPAAGSLAGTTLAGNISKWLGYGAYKVARNTIMESSNASIPLMHNSSQSVIVRHREYIGEVSSAVSYTKQLEVVLNPGSKLSFPWLSTIAQQYQEYSWRGVVFHYIPTVGEAVSTTVPAYGNVMMHTDYRVTAPEPANKAELLNEYFASDARPCETFIHPIECDPRENPYNVQYVRAGVISNTEDPKSYDLGVMRVYTQGQGAANVVMGEVWVTYEVELRKPQVASQFGDFAMLMSNTNIASTTPLGENHTTRLDTIGVTVTTITGKSRLSFPQGLIGRFMVLVQYINSGALTSTAMSLLYTNCTNAPIFGSGGTTQKMEALQTAVAANGAFAVAVDINSKQTEAEIELAMATLTNAAGVNIYIMRIATA